LTTYRAYGVLTNQDIIILIPLGPFTKSSKVLSVTMDLTQLQVVGALGAILMESLRQSKSVGSNLSRVGQ